MIWDIQSITRQLRVSRMGSELAVAGADLKIGPGGIREIEFFAQTQQLIFGGRVPTLRQTNTVDALTCLAENGLLPHTVAHTLGQYYFMLRHLEHCAQMVTDEQTHCLPTDNHDRHRIACLAGCPNLHALDLDVHTTLQYVHKSFTELFTDSVAVGENDNGLVFAGMDDNPATLLALADMGFANGREMSRILRDWSRGAIRATATPAGRYALSRLTPQLLRSAQRTGAPDAAFAGFCRFLEGLPAGAQAPALLMGESMDAGLVAADHGFRAPHGSRACSAAERS